MSKAGGKKRNWTTATAVLAAGVVGFAQTASAAGAGAQAGQSIHWIWWLCPVGSVAALYVTGQTLTVAAMVGFISLSGIATGCRT